MLAEIAASGTARSGFKASGGIRAVADAALYLQLVSANLGPDGLTPQRFRLGASALLSEIEACLAAADLR